MKFLPDFELMIIKDAPIYNLHSYNKFMTSMDFWKRVQGYDKVLIFQSDSEILREGVEEFFDYDFIGAPIYHCPFPNMNGGLSLRSVDAMTNIIKKKHYNPSLGYEDIYFTNALKEIGGKLPHKEVASKFSVETIFQLGTWGCHAIDSWLSPEQCKQIRSQY